MFATSLPPPTETLFSLPGVAYPVQRRTVVRAGAGACLAGLAGCPGRLFGGPDSDGDGDPDGEDAAPNDPRVDSFAGGDPGIAIELEPLSDPTGRDAVDLRITHEGGDTVDTDGTDRLELAAEGDPVGTVPLPFTVGDEYVVESVPVGPRLSLIWFGTDGENALVVATTTLAGSENHRAVPDP